MGNILSRGNSFRDLIYNRFLQADPTQEPSQEIDDDFILLGEDGNITVQNDGQKQDIENYKQDNEMTSIEESKISIGIPEELGNESTVPKGSTIGMFECKETKGLFRLPDFPQKESSYTRLKVNAASDYRNVAVGHFLKFGFASMQQQPSYQPTR
jgi:hypothetical protein